jgi:ribosomal protein L37AE/L43A
MTMAEKQSQEAAVAAAEESAARAEEAIEQADADAVAAAEASKENPRNRLCPHCRTEMTRHNADNPFKAGAWHCNGCGCCFKGRELRDGHSACTLSGAGTAE